jgi:hypothetical protein
MDSLMDNIVLQWRVRGPVRRAVARAGALKRKRQPRLASFGRAVLILSIWPARSMVRPVWRRHPRPSRGLLCTLRSMRQAGIYCRISDDREGAGLGVARQEARCCFGR